MLRIRILLALCFALWPSTAAAEADASETRATIARVARALGASLSSCGEEGTCAPAPSRLDLSDRTAGEIGFDGDQPGSLARRLRLEGPDLSLDAIRPPASRVEFVTPLCERLPYHATAPPARR